MLLRKPLPAEPERALILGAGAFGSRAAREIGRELSGCSVHIADLRTDIAPDLPGEHHPATEAMDLMLDLLREDRPDDLVIPCVPVHVAFNWVLTHLGFCIPVPVSLMEELPGAVAGKDGCIYSSLSDFVCPPGCREPEDECPVSGESRRYPIFDTIASLSPPSYTNLTVRSEQLLPGVGAISAGVLFDLLNRARSRRGRFLIATASRCHGVVHGFTH